MSHFWNFSSCKFNYFNFGTLACTNVIFGSLTLLHSEQPKLHGVLAILSVIRLTLYVPETQIAEFANSIDLDEEAHNEPPHLDLQCLPSSL